MPEPRIYSVSELNRSIRRLLENRFPMVSVQGEISNLRRPYSGHIYFTLKDEQGQIKAVLFKMQQRFLQQQPTDGQHVVCRGRITVYEPRGDYQLIVDAIEHYGSGSLQAAFERLKRKLDAEGLFARERKKALPALPEHITLVTSPSGAAVRDFLRIAASRFPLTRIGVFPVSVQGERAAPEMIRALTLINRAVRTDIIVLCRGGGSLEDLMAFNNEELARAIAASQIPVVSGVGHEIDFTIADLVSDLRAPTPSGAAEMILPDQYALAAQIMDLSNRMCSALNGQLRLHLTRLALVRQKLGDLSMPLGQLGMRIDHLEHRLVRGMQQRLGRHEERFLRCRRILAHHDPRVRLRNMGDRVHATRQRLCRAMEHLLVQRQQALQRQQSVLTAVAPQATLARGYAIVRKGKQGRVVTAADQVRPGVRLTILLHRGEVEATVDHARPPGSGKDHRPSANSGQKKPEADEPPPVNDRLPG